MSLAVLADHMASKGRGPDSMLIHMSPREVQGLQALAMKNGGSLTINPDTGLPEAGFLDKLLPTIIGAGLTFFSGGAINPMMAAGIVGGIQTVRTGDIGKGLAAGLGAYGGAGLTQGLSAAGTGAIGSEAAKAGAGLTGDITFNLADAGVTDAGIQSLGNVEATNQALQQQVAERVASASPFDKLSAGAKSVAENPMSFANKDNLKYLAAAAGPAIMAGANVQARGPQTVTKPGMIRPYSYDPYGGTYTAGTPYEAAPTKAADGGLMGFDNGGYSPGQLDFTQSSEPVVRMASGGYAAGGQPSMAEWLDKAGISQEAREKGSPELYEAVNAYHAMGSSLDPYRQEDTRDWGAVMAAENPTEALIQQNTPLYGGAGRVDLTDTGGMLVSGAGNPLTSDLSRYREFSIELDPVELKNQLDTIQTDTPIGRTRYNRINALYQQALMSQKPRRMAEGGIAGYADGGVPGYANGMLVGDQDVFNYFKGLDQSKLGSGALDAQIAKDMQTYNVSAADIARITGTQAQQGDFEKRFVQAINPTTLNSADFLAQTADVGLQNQALANAMQGAGMSQAAQYAATHALDDTAGIASAPKAAQDFYNAYGYKAGDAPGDKGGIAGLYTNIDYAADKLQAQIDAGALTVAQAQNLSLAEMERLGINQADVKAATGSDFANLFKAKAAPVTCGVGFKLSADGKSCVPDIKGTVTCGPGTKLSADGKSCVIDTVVVKPDAFTDVIAGDTKLKTATTYDNGAFGNYGSGPATGVDYLGRTVSIATPGDIITNPDDSRTVVPNIPGRPYGGFTGMDAVKSAYTAGGGSLGVNKNLFVPKTLDELNARYKNTGGSKQAMDYLTGKTAYDPTPYTPTGEIQKPYWESVGRFPAQEKNKNKKYLFKNGKYELNPDFVEPSYVLAAKKAAAAKETAKTDAAAGKSINVLDNEGKTEPAYLRDDGFYYTSGGNKFDEKGAQVAAGGGLAALTMANGGMAAGGQFDLGGYSDGGRLLRGPGDGVSDSIPATIGNKRPARLADGEFVVPARIVSELGNGSTEAGARKLYAMMDRVQAARKGSIGKGKVAKNSRADKYLPA